jgi:hypothetical protein
MQSSMLLIWGGALLVLTGVVYTATQAIRRGRLSEDRASRPGLATTDTLEPRARNSGFGLKANWPGLALIVFGSILLLAGASI